MPQSAKARSAAAKKAAATRKANAATVKALAEAEAEAAKRKADRYRVWEDRFKSAAIFLMGVGLALNEFFIQEDPRELGVIVACAAMSLPLALPSRKS